MATAPAPADDPGAGPPTTKAEVFERIKKIIAEQLGVEDSDVMEPSSFQEDLDADSLDLVELIMELEDKMGIKINDEEARTLTTVGEAVDFICVKLGITE